jgi:hypothetical protein
MVTLKISPYTNVTLTSGWVTLFMGDMGEGALHREESNGKTKKLKPPGTKTNWPTDRWSQYNFNLHL